ncbi:hypothetical protein COT20_00260 [bacterium (Candidatus Gribaldobacteria) CG08_land_8_20_14_0_20_39_15]|uniref:R3H domain-containing protein n=1 Tax=bacterium (Candidatus Gribaldobacteria) CG08_land_8_20_14_0_20_39_15 TaxID=2014273 RepID=A0A2M6XV96_9BACT|nr:MAG: hypothetical protein COT20_00260 [bacterium (Candidatus Gribaldobacteria) CG08_land_8_20_14_0_20_39_15]
MDNKIKKKIERLVEDFIKKTTFNITFEIKENRDGGILLDMTTDQPKVLIGEEGETFWEIQMLFNRMIKKMFEEDIHFSLDINQYKKNKESYLKELAGETANRVALFKKEEYLPAMNAYERRIIHLELATRTDVITESTGENQERRLVIKPAK